MKTRAINFLRRMAIPESSSPVMKALSWVLKVGITLAALAYIYFRLEGESRQTWQVLLHPGLWQVAGICAALLLMPLNLGWEAAKWRMMVSPFYPALTLGKSMQAVFAGISAGIFTPNGIGAYAGRVFLLPSGRRTEAAILTFLDRICLMYITLVTGTLALEYIWVVHKEMVGAMGLFSLTTLSVVRAVAWIGVATGALLAILPERVVNVVKRWADTHPAWERLATALSVLGQRRLLQVLLLSLARYLTFSLQYFLLLLAFGYVGEPGLAIMLIWMVFFVKSVVPTVSLTELGIRETIAIAVMGAFAVPAVTAMSSTFVLYLINMVLPALIGLTFVQKLRL